MIEGCKKSSILIFSCHSSNFLVSASLVNKSTAELMRTDISFFFFFPEECKAVKNFSAEHQKFFFESTQYPVAISWGFLVASWEL